MSGVGYIASFATVLVWPLAGCYVIPQYPTLASSPSGVSALAVQSPTVYWAAQGTSGANYGDGTIMSVPAAGGEVLTLATAQASPCSVAPDPTGVSWITQTTTGGGCPGPVCTTTTTATLVRLPAGDSTPVTLATFSWSGGYLSLFNGNVNISGATPGCPPLVTDGSSLFWWEPQPGSLMKVALAGGSPTAVASTGRTLLYGLVVHDANLFWVDGSGQVSSVSVNGGTVSAFAANQVSAYGIAADADNLMWLAAGSSPDAGSGSPAAQPKNSSVSAAPFSGGPTTTLATAQNEPYALGANGGHVYWGTQDGPGEVSELPVSGGKPSVVVLGVTNVAGIGMDGQNLFWASGNQIKTTTIRSP